MTTIEKYIINHTQVNAVHMHNGDRNCALFVDISISLYLCRNYMSIITNAI